MTTRLAAELYLAEHKHAMEGKGYAIYNPKDKPVNELPIIYGFNNGGSDDWWSGVLIAEDGTCLGGHTCSNEGYMLNDLGILEGTRPDRHEGFIEHYPEGYRMDFVSRKDVSTHIGLTKAYKLNRELAKSETK